MIVLCNGVFDVFHYGHLLHLQKAKEYGELLYVSVTRDAYVNKGPGRPVFPDAERAALIRALSIVHGVLLVSSSLEALQAIMPDVFVKGDEYKGKLLDADERFCKENGIKIAYTHEKTYSSTKLLHFYESRSC